MEFRILIMSDDDDRHPGPKRARGSHVHYGSLEDSMGRAGSGPEKSTTGNPSITVTHSGPNIHTSKQYYEITPDAGIQAVERASQLEAFELRKKARSIAVSTDDVEVRAHLRNLNHPMCKSFTLLDKKVPNFLSYTRPLRRRPRRQTGTPP